MAAAGGGSVSCSQLHPGQKHWPVKNLARRLSVLMCVSRPSVATSVHKARLKRAAQRSLYYSLKLAWLQQLHRVYQRPGCPTSKAPAMAASRRMSRRSWLGERGLSSGDPGRSRRSPSGCMATVNWCQVVK